MFVHLERRFVALAAYLTAMIWFGTCFAVEIYPPTFSEYFNSPSVPLNGALPLDFSITNSNATVMTGIAFTANLPSGLVVAASPNLVNSCGGSITAVAGGSSISLSAGSLAQTTCDVAINISATGVGPQTVIPIQVSSDDGASNAAGATVTVVPPPMLTLDFGAPSVELGASALLTFAIQNDAPTVAMSGVGFRNTLPPGLQVATPTVISGNCNGGIVFAPSGAAEVTLYGGSVAANDSCSFSVHVTGIAAGVQRDVTSIVSSAEGGEGGSATSEITVAPASSPTQFCVGSTADLQNALSSAAANSAVNDIRVRSGTYLLAGVLVYAPTNTKVAIVSGGWNSDCTVQTSDNHLTILDGAGQRQVLAYVAATAVGNLALQNLTIRNGLSPHYGGCLYVNTNGSFQLAQSAVQNCVAGSFGTYGGGGLWIEHASSLLVSDSTFSANQATAGAGIAINNMHSGQVTLRGAVFDANETLGSVSGDNASAVSVQDFSSPPIAQFTITDSVFLNGKGYAVNVGAGVMAVSNSIFENNSDTQIGAPQAECGSFAGQARAVNPIASGQLLIVDSQFVGSGGANAGCMLANASGGIGSQIDTVTIHNSHFSGFTAGIFPLNQAVSPPLPGLSGGYCDLRGNTFASNTGGAAVVPYCTNLTVSHNKFLNNVGAVGSPGALYVNLGSGLQVDNNLFAGNQGAGDGGAVGLDLVVFPPGHIYPLPTGTYVFSSNTFYGNQASGHGGALSIRSQYGPNPTLLLWNNLFWSNTAGSGLGGDIYFDNDYAQTFVPTPITLNNKAYLQSTAGYYVRLPVAPMGSGNINAEDPHFINAGTGDFRLGSGSPMIDAGNNAAPEPDNIDLGGLPRIANGTIDIGAYEYDGDEIFRSGFESLAF